MFTDQQKICSELYKIKSRSFIQRKQEQYEKWLIDYTPYLREAYDLTIKSVKGVNPSYDEFCRFMYKSFQNGFNPSCIKSQLS